MLERDAKRDLMVTPVKRLKKLLTEHRRLGPSNFKSLCSLDTIRWKLLIFISKITRTKHLCDIVVLICNWYVLFFDEVMMLKSLTMP